MFVKINSQIFIVMINKQKQMEAKQRDVLFVPELKIFMHFSTQR